MSADDPLAAFPVWDGGELGPEEDLPPGIYGSVKATGPVLHIAGAHGTTTIIGRGRDKPAIFLRVVARVVGQSDVYRVIEGVVEAEVAEQWGAMLLKGAARSRLDLDAFNEQLAQVNKEPTE